jgi:hypothetical protein
MKTNSNRIMCLTCVQAPNKIIAERGKKQVGFITCSERVTVVALCVGANETGNCLTPIFEVPRKGISRLFSSR